MVTVPQMSTRGSSLAQFGDLWRKGSLHMHVHILSLVVRDARKHKKRKNFSLCGNKEERKQRPN